MAGPVPHERPLATYPLVGDRETGEEQHCWACRGQGSAGHVKAGWTSDVK